MHFELLGIKHVRAFDSNLLIVSVSLREDSQLTRLVGCYLAETDTRRGAAMASVAILSNTFVIPLRRTEGRIPVDLSADNSVLNMDGYTFQTNKR